LEDFLMTDVEQAVRRSWRFRRRIKRLLFWWIVICFLCAEAGASWFGIFIAKHAPMPLADAKVIAERTATAVFAVSFAAMMVSAVLQFRARERLRRIESARVRSSTQLDAPVGARGEESRQEGQQQPQGT
jgi:hypothetical protein